MNIMNMSVQATVTPRAKRTWCFFERMKDLGVGGGCRCTRFPASHPSDWAPTAAATQKHPSKMPKMLFPVTRRVCGAMETRV